jgi:hypothetical protein
MSRKLKIDDFVLRSTIIHGYKYSYEKVVYFNLLTKVEIVCSAAGHGSFWQTPGNHMAGHGCKKCATEENARNLASTTEKFILDSINIHGDLYDYSLVVYKTCKEKVKIICKIHGSFKQEPQHHLAGSGCPDCGHDRAGEYRRYSTDQFIEDANKIHNCLYDYSLVVYHNMHTKVKIKCSKHNVFEQRPQDHLNGQGCPDCKKYTKSENEWLDTLNIPSLEKQKRIFLTDGKLVKADGYDPTTNTIYEYHGKYWHGHPDKSDPDRIIKGKSAGDRYIETLMREIRLKELGYNIISVWV